MAIKINGQDLLKRYINGQEILRVYKNGSQVRPDTIPPTPTSDYLCFTANQSNSTVQLNLDDWYGDLDVVSIEISQDKTTWSDYTLGDTITLSNVGDKVYMRNKSETQVGFSTGGSQYYYFSMTGSISGSGDVGFLLCKNSTTTLSDYCFYSLFRDCASLTTPPDLPATTLGENCYGIMFGGCTSLTTAPVLPATTIESRSYSYMFSGCTSLTTAPTLPATTLNGEYCYLNMFLGCTSLVNVPTLPATNLQSGLSLNHYERMFAGCTSLVNAPKMLFSTAVPGLCKYMFAGCTSLETLPDLDKGLASYCFENMFDGCTKIKISETQTGEYQTPIIIGDVFNRAPHALDGMFNNTGGTFTGTPNFGQTYYTSNTIIS